MSERIITRRLDRRPGPASHDSAAVLADGHHSQIVVGDLVATAFLGAGLLARRDHGRRGRIVGGAGSGESGKCSVEHTGADGLRNIVTALDHAIWPAGPGRAD